MFEADWWLCLNCRSRIRCRYGIPWSCDLCRSWRVVAWPKHRPPGDQVELFAFGNVDGDMVTPDDRDAREAKSGLVELLDRFRER